MSCVTLKAHYDGERIQLDEPFDIPPNAPLTVTVFMAADADLEKERADWTALSLQSLARAYGEDEPEYTLADLKK